MKPRVECISVVSTETTIPDSSGMSAYSHGIRHRTMAGEARRFMADHAHAVGEEIEMIVVLRFHAQRLGRGVDFPPHSAGAHHLHGGALDALDLGQEIHEFGVGLALDRHAADVADIAVVIAAGVDRHYVALLPFLVGGRAIVAGAGGDEAIFESEPAVDFFTAQRVNDIVLGRAGPVIGDHRLHRGQHGFRSDL